MSLNPTEKTTPPRGEDPESIPRRTTTNQPTDYGRQTEGQPATCIFKPWQGQTRREGREDERRVRVSWMAWREADERERKREDG